MQLVLVISRFHLQGLRLNCLLAVLVPVGMAACALIALGHWHRHLDQQHQLRQAQLVLQSYIAGLGSPTNVQDQAHPLHALGGGQQHWNGLAQLVLDGDGTVTEIGRQGQLEIDYDFIPPELTWAVAGAQAWSLGAGKLGVAAPWLDQEGVTTSIFYGETTLKFTDKLWWYYVAAALMLCAGGVLGWYLIRRVYLPVTALTQQAQAALRGEPHIAMYSSAETQQLSAAISQLSATITGGSETATNET